MINNNKNKFWSHLKSYLKIYLYFMVKNKLII